MIIKFKKDILYVESSYSSHKIVRVFLEENYNLINAENSLKAVELYKSSNNIDLILLEVGTPEVNSLEFTKKFRELNKDIPIIAIINYFVKEETKEKLAESGCNLLLEKPVSKPQLLEAIIEQLES